MIRIRKVFETKLLAAIFLFMIALFLTLHDMWRKFSEADKSFDTFELNEGVFQPLESKIISQKGKIE